jgi:glycosyltransferase involved in cell wall biosynthesis
LPNTEHACCGKPQIVPNHSACKELFEGYGALISLRASQVNHDTNTVSFIPDPISLAQNLRTLYENKELRKTLGNKGQLKFTSPEYLWGNISNKFKEVFEECLQ